MPYTITKHPDPSRIEIKYSGIITGEDLVNAINEFVTINADKRYLLVLTDLSELSISPSLLNVYDRIEMYEKLDISKETTEAVIIPISAFAKETVKFYDTACLNRGYNVKLFSTKDEALAWLGFYG